MILYFDKQSLEMIGWAKADSNFSIDEDINYLIFNDEIIYNAPNWEPEYTNLPDGRTWVKNEMKLEHEGDEYILNNVSESEMNYKNLKIKKDLTLHEAKLSCKDKINELTDGLDLAYIIYKAQAIKNNDSFVEELLNVEANVLKTDVEVIKEESQEKFQILLRKVNSVYVHFQNFLNQINSAQTMSEVDESLEYFNFILAKFIR